MLTDMYANGGWGFRMSYQVLVEEVGHEKEQLHFGETFADTRAKNESNCTVFPTAKQLNANLFTRRTIVANLKYLNKQVIVFSNNK